MLRRMGAAEAYALLGLAHGAGLDDVKAAFRKRALQCHPDTGAGNPDEFIRITQAYNTLLRTSAPGLTSSPDPWVGQRYAAGRVVYASGLSGARSSRTATMVWGVGLGLGGMLFAGILLLGRTIVPRTVHAGPSRVVEPSRDSAKRERIANLLMEKAALKAGGGDEKRNS